MVRKSTEPLSLEGAKQSLRRESQRSERGLLPVYNTRKLIRHYPKGSVFFALALGMLIARSPRFRRASLRGLRFGLQGFNIFNP